MRLSPHSDHRAGRCLRTLVICLSVIGPATASAALAQEAGAAPSVPYGEDAAALQPLVDRIVGEAVAREGVPGAIVGVSWRGRRAFFGYGGTPYAPDTIVEIGSITKVFTTALFAEAVQEGAMRRDAPIQEYLPRVRLRPCAGAVTPLQLADFTSGMPELPGDVPRRLTDRGIDTYTSEDFLAWVARWTPGESDGCGQPAPYRYSNASVGLLGYLVAERLGARWEDLVRARITGPLRMASTNVRVPPDQAGRVAQGFGPEGNPVIPWPVFSWYAAGALRSTAADMLAFGEAALGHERVNGERVPPALVSALSTAMAPIYQPDGQPFVQAMAWVENPGDPDAGTRPVTFKTGGTDGFNSIIVINPGKDLAVFIAGSRPKMQIERLGVSLSRQIR